jgi:hypothetical protein
LDSLRCSKKALVRLEDSFRFEDRRRDHIDLVILLIEKKMYQQYYNGYAFCGRVIALIRVIDPGLSFTDFADSCWYRFYRISCRQGEKKT